MNVRPTESQSPENSPFDTVSETTRTRQERYRDRFNELLVTPVRIVWSDYRMRFGSLIVLGFVLMGTVGVYLTETPSTGHPHLVPPFQSWEYPLGTDLMGQPVFGQIMHATPAMLKMILAGAVFATVIATILGLLSGYKGGRVDSTITTISDIAMTIPGLPLIIVLAAILRPESPYVVGVILTINAWAGLSRTIRAQVLSIREESYVEAARCMGISTPSILQKDILPNIMPYIMINFVQSARQVIFASVGLYFLGILPFTNFNWGVMLNMSYTQGAMYTLETAHAILAPMLAIVLLSYGMILIAQGSDVLFNPRVRARHAEGRADVTEETVSAAEQDATTMVR